MAAVKLELGFDLVPMNPPRHRPELGPCWEWTGTKNANGYGVSPKSVNGTRLVHRISLMNELGRDLDGMVLHLCDNPPCARPGLLKV